jgi:hypothetical protein
MINISIESEFLAHLAKTPNKIFRTVQKGEESFYKKDENGRTYYFGHPDSPKFIEVLSVDLKWGGMADHYNTSIKQYEYNMKYFPKNFMISIKYLEYKDETLSFPIKERVYLNSEDSLRDWDVSFDYTYVSVKHKLKNL